MSYRRRRSIINLLKSRRSIRIFKPVPLPSEIVKLLVEAGLRAPTFFQMYSFIWVKSSEKREKLAELCSGEIVRNASIILLACGDLRRLSKMLEMLEHRHVLSSDKHPVETIMSIFDTALAVENIIIAAESLGLGSVILDCPLLYAPIIAQLFQLPKGVVPFALICIGVKGESPPLRPRLSLNIILHEDTYRDPTTEELKDFISNLDKHMEYENYVKKYTGKDGKYIEYIKAKTELTKETEKENEVLIKYLRENLFRI